MQEFFSICEPLMMIKIHPAICMPRPLVAGETRDIVPGIYQRCVPTVPLFVLFACFVGLLPKSTAMVLVGRSVHLTTLFS